MRLTTTVRKAEFDRQVQTLVDLGYPPLADLSETAFRALLEPLRERVTAYGQLEEPTAEMVPFVLVIGRRLVRPDDALVTVTDAGRSPLTTDEGVALITTTRTRWRRTTASSCSARGAVTGGCRACGSVTGGPSSASAGRATCTPG